MPGLVLRIAMQNVIIVSSHVVIEEADIVRCFSRVNANKAPVSDGLRGRVLKVGAEQLGPFFTRLFQLLLDYVCGRSHRHVTVRL